MSEEELTVTEPKEEIVSEYRNFKTHQNLLWSVIHKQAGSIDKAILEGVMNSVDAGSTECHIEIDKDRFSIRDDGKGFSTDAEIEQFFETFGTPHEEGDAKYGKFRMGRGQLMAFGVNNWHTNNFKMNVNLKPQEDGVKNDGFSIGYDFKKVKENYKGCDIKVELYDQLTPSSLDQVIRQIKENIVYVDIPVFLNGKRISKNPADMEWDEITDDAYIKRKGGGTLDIYNQGVLVTKQSQYVSGVSGVVVSKKDLDINFARNSVQASCPIWKRILKKLKDDNMQVLKRKSPLDDAKRDFFSRQLISAEISISELDGNRIITDITNSHHPFDIFTRLDTFQNKVSIAERGDRVAEMAHNRRLAFVVSSEMAERFNASTPEEFVKAIGIILKNNHKKTPKIIPIDVKEFSKVISSKHEPIADKELNKAERVALSLLREANKTMYRDGCWYDYQNNAKIFSKSENDIWSRRDSNIRKISVGSSDTALAWTDGDKNIWFERRQLKEIRSGMPGMLKLANIMLHEYLHNGPSTDTHEHGVEFYQRHHDLNIYTNIVSNSADTMLKEFTKMSRKDGKHIAQAMALYEDRRDAAAKMGVGVSVEDIPDFDENNIIPVIENEDSNVVYNVEASPLIVDTVKTKRKLKVEEDSPQITLKF